MMRSVAWHALEGEQVVETKSGNANTPKLGPYGATTLITKSGKQFVVWQAYGEVNLSLVTD